MSSNVKVLEDAEALSNVSVVDFTHTESVNVITNEPITINVNAISVDNELNDDNNSPLSVSPISLSTPESPLPPLPTQLPPEPVLSVNNNDITPVIVQPVLDEPVVTELKPKSSNVEIVKNEIATMDTPSTDQKFQENLEFCYNRLVELVHGTKYSLTNWSLLIIKALKCVSHVKGLTAQEQCDLGLKVIILYLDNNTPIDDAVLLFIKSQARPMIMSVLEKQGFNAKNHKANTKGTGKMQKRIDGNSKKTDIDILASPLQIINSVINKIEAAVKSRKLNFDNFQAELPTLLLTTVAIVDKYKHLTASEKKHILIQAVEEVLGERVPVWFKLGEKETKNVELLAASIPQMIETCIGIANGDPDFRVDFNNPGSLIKLASRLRFLLPLLPCLKKKAN